MFGMFIFLYVVVALAIGIFLGYRLARFVDRTRQSKVGKAYNKVKKFFYK